MPKILRLINRLNLGGPTFNAAYLSKYLAPEFETILVSGMKDETEASSEFIVREMGIEPLYIPEMKREINLKQDRIAFKKIKKLIQEFKPDIVHTHAAKAGALGRLAASVCQVPVIVHTFHGHVFHSYFNNLTSKVFVHIERYLAKKSTRIIAISDLQRQELAMVHKICPIDKIEMIPLGFDLQRFRVNQEEKRNQFRKKYLLDENEIAIGIVGRIVPVKNHYLFLRALKNVISVAKNPVRAFIIGDGESRNHVETLAMDLQIDCIDFNRNPRKATLTFTSWINEIDHVFNGLDIVALTSLNEGTPVSLIEAQAAGKPIVTTNVGGIENAVVPGVTALLCESGNAIDFATNLIQLIEEESLRKKLSEYGWDHVKNKFDYSRLVSEMRVMYNSLSANNLK